MEVTVDEVTHGLLGDVSFDLRQQGHGRRRFGVSIDDEHVAIQDKDRCVAVSQSLRLRERGENSIGYLLDGEQIGGRCLRLRARPSGAKERFFEDAGACQYACKRAAKEVAASMCVM